MHEIPAVTVNHCAQGHRLQIAVAEYNTVTQDDPITKHDAVSKYHSIT
jgi:hypothetical protein